MDAKNISISVLILCAVLHHAAAGSTLYEKSLMKHLLSGYGDRTVRPVNDSSETLDVRVRLLIAQVIKFDEPLQQLIINGWLKMAWNDVYLKWDPEEWDNITTVSVFTDRIWRPDVTFWENIDEKWESIKQIEASLTSDGTVTWFAPTIVQLACKVKVRFFPFDFQRCNITIGSWRYDKSKLNMHALDDEDANQYVFDENGVWMLHSAKMSSVEEVFKCCPHPYTLIVIEMTLNRNPGFYVYNIIVPCVLLSIMTVFVFRLPPESGEKISLGMTNVLALILFQQLIAENMPPLGDEMPVIGVYFLSMIVMGCISVMTTVVILRIYHYPGSKPIPSWVRYVINLRSKGKTGSKPSSKVTDISSTETFQNILSSSNGIGIWAFATDLEKERNARANTDNTPIDGAQDRQSIVAEWRHLAFFLDKAVLAILTFGMVVVFLYVCAEYWMYWSTLKRVTDHYL